MSRNVAHTARIELGEHRRRLRCVVGQAFYRLAVLMERAAERIDPVWPR